MKLPRVLVPGACLCGLVLSGASQQEPEDARSVVRTLAAELSRAEDVNAFLIRNRGKITPNMAAAADELAALDLETGNAKEAKAVAEFGAAAFRRLGDTAGETKMSLTVTFTQIAEAKGPEEFANLRTRAQQLRGTAAGLNRPDLVFAAEAIATVASISQYRVTESQPKALPVLLQSMTDAAAALTHMHQSNSRTWVQVLVRRLVWLLDDSSGFPFHVLRAAAERDARLKQIAAGVEREIPADFHFAPAFGREEDTVQAAMVLASLSYAYGSAEAGRKRLELAVQLAKEMGDPDLWASVVTTLSEAEWAANAPAARVKLLRDQAWRVATAVRSMYASRAGRIWAAYRTDQIFGDVLLHQLNQKGATEPAMFAAAEALKARTLLDELALPRPSIPALEHATELEQAAIGFEPLPKDLFRDNPSMGSEMSLISQQSAFDLPGDRSRSRAKAMDQLESIYRKAGTGFQNVAPTASLNEVRQALGPREAVLEYVIPFSPADPVPGLWMLFITRDRLVLAKSPLETVEVENCSQTGRTSVGGAPLDMSPLTCLIVNLREAIQRNNQAFAREALGVLHYLLIDPVLAQDVRLEDFDRLIVVPQGPLHYVPFAALLDRSGKFLVSRVGITMAPSASVWQRLSLRSGGIKGFAGYANSRLELAGEEMAGIEPLVKSAGWTADITSSEDKERLLRNMKSAGILHLATHAGFPEENAQDRHYLEIGPGDSPHTVLTAGEVRALDLSATRLAVLSVCNGGLYRLGPGNEVYGLMPAFLEAGAQNVMGTLWELEDTFGKAFMAEFYKHLEAGGPTLALRETQRHFIDNNELIVNWAAFVVMGAGSFAAPPDPKSKLEGAH